MSSATSGLAAGDRAATTDIAASVARIPLPFHRSDPRPDRRMRDGKHPNHCEALAVNALIFDFSDARIG
jgi:hypothetical protein